MGSITSLYDFIILIILILIPTGLSYLVHLGIHELGLELSDWLGMSLTLGYWIANIILGLGVHAIIWVFWVMIMSVIFGD